MVCAIDVFAFLQRQFRVAVIRKPGVPPFDPELRFPGLYEEGEAFRELFLTKLINGERMAMYAPDFVRKMYRARKELMNILLKVSLRLLALGNDSDERLSRMQS